MNAKIVILNNDCDIDEYRDIAGELAIPMPIDAGLTLVKKREELTNLERIVSDFSFSFDLFVTDTVAVILQNAHRKIDVNFVVYRAYLVSDELVLIDGNLYVDTTKERIFDGNTTYSCQIIGTNQTWKEQAKATKICQLDLGEYFLSRANVVQHWRSQYNYQDTDQYKVYPLAADFGRNFFYSQPFPFSTPAVSLGLTTHDLRFMVWAKALIDAMFAKFGYRVSSDFFNTPYFRSVAMYLHSKNFYNHSRHGEGYRVEAYTDSDVMSYSQGSVSYLDFLATNEITDSKNLFVIPPGSGNYPRIQNNTNKVLDGIQFTLTGQVCRNMVGLGFGELKFAILKPTDTNVTNIPITTDIPNNQIDATFPCANFSTTFNIDLLYPQGMNPNDEILLILYVVNVNPFADNFYKLNAGAKIQTTAFNGTHFYEDERIAINETLTCEYDCYKVLQDLKVLYNLRFETNQASKTVRIEPMQGIYQNYRWHALSEMSLRGFNGSQSDESAYFDITKYIDNAQFVERNFAELDIVNGTNFLFKESTDKNALYSVFGASNPPLYSKLVGVQDDTTKELQLSVFEPTLNIFKNVYAETSDGISIRQELDTFMPVMHDFNSNQSNSQLALSVDIKPRIMCVYGFVMQFPKNDTQFSIWHFETPTYLTSSSFPTVAQVCKIPIRRQLFEPTPARPFFNVAFDDNESTISGFQPDIKNLVNTFYAEELKSKDKASIKLELYIPSMEFKQLSMRKIALIDSEVSRLNFLNGLYQIIEISFPIEANKPTIITLKPY